MPHKLWIHLLLLSDAIHSEIPLFRNPSVNCKRLLCDSPPTGTETIRVERTRTASGLIKPPLFAFFLCTSYAFLTDSSLQLRILLFFFRRSLHFSFDSCQRLFLLHSKSQQVHRSMGKKVKINAVWILSSAREWTGWQIHSLAWVETRTYDSRLYYDDAVMTRLASCVHKSHSWLRLQHLSLSQAWHPDSRCLSHESWWCALVYFFSSPIVLQNRSSSESLSWMNREKGETKPRCSLRVCVVLVFRNSWAVHGEKW